MIPLWYTKIDENGDLVLPRSLDFKTYCDSLAGKRVVITLEELKRQRSLDQNAYYWLVLKLIADTTGHLPIELHSIYKRMFIEPKFVEYNGKTIKLPKSTAELGVSEFSEYLERVIAEASGLGVVVPDPSMVK